MKAESLEIESLRRRVQELESELLRIRSGQGISSQTETPATSSDLNLLNSIDDGFALLDAQWRFTRINRNAEFILRRQSGSLLGRCLWEEYPELLGTTAEQTCRRVMEERVAHESQEYLPFLGGWFQGRCFPSPDGGIFVLFRNITEQKTAEAALRWNEERWRSLANALPQFVWIARSFGEVQFINDYWYEYTGLSAGDLGTADWSKVLPVEDLELIAEMWRQAIASGTEQSFEYRVRRGSDGMWRWHRGLHRPERDRSGTIVRWIGIGFDIHDLKIAREANHATAEGRL